MTPVLDAFSQAKQRLAHVIGHGETPPPVPGVAPATEVADGRPEALAEALRDTAAALSSTLNLDEVLDRILDNVGRVVPHDAADIMEVEGNSAHIVRSRGYDRFGPQEWVVELRHDIVATAGLAEMQATAQPVLIADTAAHPGWKTIPELSWIRSYIAAPLRVKGRLIGFLNLNSATPGFFNEAYTSRLQAFADQAAIALENARLFADAQRRLRETLLLNRVIAAVTSILDPSAVMQTVCKELADAFSVPYVAAAFWNEAQDRLTIVATNLESTESGLGLVLPVRRNSAIDQITQQHVPLVVADLASDDRLSMLRDLADQLHLTSMLALPLVARDRDVGILGLATVERRVFAADDITLAQNVAAAISQALENATLYAQTQQRANELAAVNELTNEFAAQGNTLAVSETVVERAKTLLGVCSGAVFLFDEERQELVHNVSHAGTATEAARIKMGDGVIGLAATRRQSVIVNDVAAWPEPRCRDHDQQLTSVLAVPMLCRGDLIGVMAVGDAQPSTHVFVDADARLLLLFAGLAANVIRLTRVLEESNRRIRELECINRISTALRTAQAVADILPVLLDETLTVLKTDSGSISIYDPATGDLSAHVARGWPSNVKALPVRWGQGISGLVFATGEPYLSQDVAADPQLVSEVAPHAPLGCSGAYVPVRAGQDVIGVLFVAVQQPRHIAPEDVHLLTTVAEVAGNAIHRTHLNEQTERTMQRLASLHAVDSAIAGSRDLQVALDVILDQITSHMGVDAADVVLLDSQTQLLRYAGGRGVRLPPGPAQISLTRSLAGRVALSRRTVNIPDIALAGDDLVDLARGLINEGVKAYSGFPLIAKGQVKGVLELFQRATLKTSPEWLSFFETLAGQAALAIDDAMMFSDLQRSNAGLILAYDATIEGWARALSLRDRETEAHTRRVTELTLRLALAAGIPESDMIHLRRGALLHDIGKMGIPDSILFKPGPLTDEEWQIMRRHPSYAYALLYPIPYLRPALEIPYCHHEWWNGQGYPQGLKEEMIPLAARVFAVVDTWDSVTSDRPYHKAWPRDKAIGLLRDNAGVQFDRPVVELFLRQILNAGA